MLSPRISRFRSRGTSLLGLLVLPVLLFGLLAGSTSSGPHPGSDDPAARGAYLVATMGCNDCHTPWVMGERGPEPDMTRMLSGHPGDMKMPPPPDLGQGPWLWAGAATNSAFAGPWGVSYAFNLTPDSTTGLGAWTEEMFIKALRTGWHMGVENSRPIMPPMPWPAYGQATDEDLKAIFAYLRTIPPVRNHVPAYEPPAAAGHEGH